MKLNIPFCTRKPSFVGRALVETGKTDLVRRYVLALAQELAANGEEFSDCRVEAVRLGGGTAIAGAFFFPFAFGAQVILPGHFLFAEILIKCHLAFSLRHLASFLRY